MRGEQDSTGDRNAAMPDRSPVDPVEPLLHPRQRADEHGTDRQEQDRLGAEQLPEVAPRGLACRLENHPQRALGDDEARDQRWPELPWAESPVHTATLDGGSQTG